jgi:hypothetical protein
LANSTVRRPAIEGDRYRDRRAAAYRRCVQPSTSTVPGPASFDRRDYLIVAAGTRAGPNRPLEDVYESVPPAIA